MLRSARFVHVAAAALAGGPRTQAMTAVSDGEDMCNGKGRVSRSRAETDSTDVRAARPAEAEEGASVEPQNSKLRSDGGGKARSTAVGDVKTRRSAAHFSRSRVETDSTDKRAARPAKLVTDEGVSVEPQDARLRSDGGVKARGAAAGDVKTRRSVTLPAQAVEEETEEVKMANKLLSDVKSMLTRVP